MNDELISSTMDESGLMTYDLVFTRVAAGRPEELRARLAEAFERLDFYVVDDTPLIAKRRTTKWAAAGCSANPTELAATVQVALKSAGPNATRVTFNYTIKHTWLMGWDRTVLAREADALVAYATRPKEGGACGLCGTEALEDSRFCRRCGAPLATYEPPEFEALRLMAGTYSGYQSVVFGAALLLVTIVLCAVYAMFVDSDTTALAKLAKVSVVLGSMAGMAAFISLVMGTWRLRDTLNPGRQERVIDAAGLRRQAFPSGRTSGLPALEAPPPSVTEATTNLLEEEPSIREPIEALRARGRDTA